MTTRLTIGEKVKQLRKAKGLTQTDLAGEQMTKSMLSQIENGRALPSMSSLQFLAGRLGVDAGYFMQGEHEAELAPLVRKIEQQYKAKQYKEIVTAVQPLMKDNLPMTVDAARLMEFYVGSCYYTAAAGGKEGIERAAEIYERFGLYVERAKVQYLAYALMFAESKYQDSLELIRRVRTEYVSNKVGNDFLFEIDLHYAECVTLSALGDYSGCREVALAALQLSRGEGVYYLTDHLYRILSQVAMLHHDLEQAADYLNKAAQFAEFTEAADSLELVHLSRIRLALALQKYEDVLALVKQYPQDSSFMPIVYLMNGIALYHLMRHEEALESLNKVTMLDQLYHPLDRVSLLTTYSYKAKIYMQQGMREEALQQSRFAYHEAKDFPPSEYLDLIQQTYHELHG
ncbi:helix-turn-helix transcriptional regulator [Paenibacillus sp. MMS20-IR301]|uniref:helix-turn-helix domain-containing protein n=1 Tax=Paenibacillus sp. MMS20-IR301 TaxID=2895946 RepID=UPI0028EAB7B4|nr:helix-turn-helix transcriptional regulator [Paenibacillus sp. MMS20-IR301]WNS44163.1 helix-turn-helix transcriptional regulator [Paenibacillus sp. MMS20-IR301]